MGRFRSLLFVLGRTFISLFSLISFVEMILYWQSTKDYFTHVTEFWLNDFAESGGEMNILIHLITLTEGYESIIIALAGVIELIGGVCLFFGTRIKLGGSLLLLYFIPKTVICHPFWLQNPLLLVDQLSNFMKNLAIIGSLFILFSLSVRGRGREAAFEETTEFEEDEA